MGCSIEQGREGARRKSLPMTNTACCCRIPHPSKWTSLPCVPPCAPALIAPPFLSIRPRSIYVSHLMCACHPTGAQEAQGRGRGRWLPHLSAWQGGLPQISGSGHCPRGCTGRGTGHGCRSLAQGRQQARGQGCQSDGRTGKWGRSSWKGVRKEWNQLIVFSCLLGSQMGLVLGWNGKARFTVNVWPS